MERGEHVETLLEVTRLVHDEPDLLDLLPDVAATLSRAFGYDIVVLSLYRPATQDIESVVVHGGGPAGQASRGNGTPLAAWVPLLGEQFAQEGCQFIPAGSIDWHSWGGDVVWPEHAVA